MSYNGEKIGCWILRHGQRAKIKSACSCRIYPMGFQRFCTQSSWNYHHQFRTHNASQISHTHRAMEVLSPLLFTSLLIRWGATQVQFVFGLITQKKWSHGRSPKIGFTLNCCHLAHLYMWNGCNICQSIWVQGEVYGEHVGEYIENLANIVRTWWELKGNIVGTREFCNKSSSKPPLPPLTKKEKMQGTLSACLGLHIGCMKFLFPKVFITIFGLNYTSHKSNIFLLNLIGPWQKKLKLWRLPKIEDSMKCLPLWPTYIGEKGRTSGKTYGIKARCDWEHPWGTHWEQRKNEKILLLHSPPPPQNLKGKNKALWVQAEPSHWLHETSIRKTVCHHFQPSLIPPL